MMTTNNNQCNTNLCNLYLSTNLNLYYYYNTVTKDFEIQLLRM